MFRLWCELDYGQDSVIFTSEQAGKNWLDSAILNIDGIEYYSGEFPNCVEDLFNEGLAGFEPVTIIGAS